MDPTICCVPDSALGTIGDGPLIVRSHSPTALARAVEDGSVTQLEYLQLLGPEADPAPLVALTVPVPIDIVLTAPAEQYTQLYKFAPLLESHPVRVTISVVPGFSRAVRLAAALQYSVKLDLGQPDAHLVDELLEALDLYLHRPTVSRPVEYFHSVLLSFVRGTPDSLWQIQEEDPARNRYVSDDPETTRVRRKSACGPDDDPSVYLEAFEGELHAEGRECRDCEFSAVCHGYFKYPDRDYDCTGVKKIFREIEAAARTVVSDLEAGSAS